MPLKQLVTKSLLTILVSNSIFSGSAVVAAASEHSEIPSFAIEEIHSIVLLGTCGQSFNPSVRGGKAHWTIDCVNGNAGVRGWVEDTRSDGKCAQVKATWGSDRTTKLSPKACPKGQRRSFELRGKGATVNAYLYLS